MTKIYDLVDEFNHWNLLPSSAELLADDVYINLNLSKALL